ncbi:MAG: 30S ribosomal protein S20 [Candidatus Melainabacteria bacterium]|nr:30S ribosomal protein S20 [Candidatus Melainabacteria bacterium]MBI3308005.1 30S ribosomal protein S20 [Candidatus Melainabacteria bacterium]
MPRLKSAIKRARVNKRYRAYNLSYKTAIKTIMKKIAECVAKNDYDEASKVKNQAFSLIDKAKCKGIIHLNFAAKKKSTIAKWLKKIEPSTKQSSKSEAKS